MLWSLFENPAYFLLMIPAVLIALVVHEVSHGYVAYLCGDNTAKAYGRLTLNPLKHLDPFGAFMMMLTGFGYAKPVPVNYRNLRKPRRDIALVSLAGPLSNLLLALIACVLYFVILLVYASSAEVRAETVAAGLRWLPSPAVMYEQAGLMSLLFMGEGADAAGRLYGIPRAVCVGERRSGGVQSDSAAAAGRLEDSRLAAAAADGGALSAH